MSFIASAWHTKNISRLLTWSCSVVQVVCCLGKEENYSMKLGDITCIFGYEVQTQAHIVDNIF